MFSVFRCLDSFLSLDMTSHFQGGGEWDRFQKKMKSLPKTDYVAFTRHETLVKTVQLKQTAQLDSISLSHFPQGLSFLHHIFVDSLGCSLLLGTKIYDSARKKFTFSIQVIVFQDFTRKEIMCSRNGGICLTFNRIDKRYTVLLKDLT